MKNFLMTLSLAIMFGLGWFANQALRTQTIYAAAKVEYKIVPIVQGAETPAGMEKTLNTYAHQGWRLHGISLQGFIFER